MSDIFDKCDPCPPKHGGFVLIRYLVRIEAVDYTGKAKEAIESCICTVEDIDSAILGGRVIKRQKDKHSADGRKYSIIGPDVAGYDFYCCGKIMKGINGVVFLVITAHEASNEYMSKSQRRRNV